MRPTAGAGQNASVVNVPAGGVDVATATITTTATSRLLISGAAELEGAAADERAQCVLRLNGYRRRESC